MQDTWLWQHSRAFGWRLRAEDKESGLRWKQDWIDIKRLHVGGDCFARIIGHFIAYTGQISDYVYMVDFAIGWETTLCVNGFSESSIERHD
jgi:hypothetical protein